MNKKLKALSCAFAALILLTANSTNASDWAGATGNWTSTVSPGWTVGGVPNAQGAIANFGAAANVTGVTTQNIAAGVTVGTISFSAANANVSRTITLTNPLTLDQDGGGAGTATISNTNTNAGATNALILSAGTLTLADNLLISNTGASANTTGAIQVLSAIGGSGNVTLSNASTALSQTGSIRLQTGVSTFTGSVLIQKGTVTSNTASSYGNSANVITLGQSGQGSAALGITAANLGNNMVVASGSGGTLTLGRFGVGTSTFSGTITLNGNLTVYSETTNATGFLLSNIISGAGSLTATSGGGATIVQLSGTNTYTGNTLISGGTLRLGNNLALQNSALDTSGAGVMNVTGFTTPTFGGLTGSTNLASVITTGYAAVTALTLNPQSGSQTYSGVIADGAAGMTLTKSGAGTQILSNANTYTGLTTVTAGTLREGVSNAIASGGVTVNGSAAVFDIGANSDTVGAVTLTDGSITGTSGTLTGSSYGVANGSISAKLGGTGVLSKTTGGTVILTGANSYSGGTNVNTGTLALNANNVLPTSGTVSMGGGTLQLNGTQQGSTPTPGAGPMSLVSSSVIDLASTDILHFAASGSQSWATGQILSIWNWNGLPTTGGGPEQILFGTDTTSASLTATQLAQINFYSDSGTTLLGGGGAAFASVNDGEIVPTFTMVPEPGTWAAGALIAASLLVSQRRRFARASR